MPENYIALFEAPEQNEALEIIAKAEPVLDEAARLIKNREAYAQPAVTLKDRLSSSIVNDIYYPAVIHAKKFYATDRCTSCGMCERICPLKNIDIKEGKPVWKDRCTHCMACICRCPAEAIEYGSLFEAAEIDGCSPMGIFFKIVLPLSKAALITQPPDGSLPQSLSEYISDWPASSLFFS